MIRHSGIGPEGSKNMSLLVCWVNRAAVRHGHLDHDEDPQPSGALVEIPDGSLETGEMDGDEGAHCPDPIS